jgi:hypothetical protein
VVENGLRKLSRVDQAAKKKEILETDLNSDSMKKRRFFESLKIVAGNPVYVFAVLGYCGLTFTLGGSKNRSYYYYYY